MCAGGWQLAVEARMCRKQRELDYVGKKEDGTREGIDGNAIRTLCTANAVVAMQWKISSLQKGAKYSTHEGSALYQSFRLHRAGETPPWTAGRRAGMGAASFEVELPTARKIPQYCPQCANR